jgi:hypothetical protein
MHDDPTIADAPPEPEDWDDEPQEALPRRRPPRRLTPLHGALLAILLVACGFIGGVLVEKGQTSAGGGGGGGPAAAFAAARPGGGARPGGFAGFGGGGAGAQATIGQVTTVDGSTLYVTTTDGTTLKVKALKGATVTRTVSGSVRAIHPGETVIVQGTSSRGTISATSIRASPAPAGGGGGGGGAVNQLFGGGQSGAATTSKGG